MTRIIMAIMALIILTGCGADPMGETSREKVKAERDIGIAVEAARADIETERLRTESAIETEWIRQKEMTERVEIDAKTKPTLWFTIAAVILGVIIIRPWVGITVYQRRAIIDDQVEERRHQRELERLQVTGGVRYLPPDRGTLWRQIDAQGHVVELLPKEQVPHSALLEANRAVSD